MAGKASAVAYPIQGLVKYHGLRSVAKRLPYHGSISVCTSPTLSHTTVQVVDDGADHVVVDGRVVEGRSLERCVAVLDEVRHLTGDYEGRTRFRVESRNNFPKFVGLGSSASGFAALAKAGFAAVGYGASVVEVGSAARLGAGSACRSVSGAFSEWVGKAGKSYGVQLAGAEDLPWATTAVVVLHDVPTEHAHEDFPKSPYFGGRLRVVRRQLEAARVAIRNGDSEALMEIAERDTLLLHGATMAGPAGLIAWRGVSVEVLHRVREMRSKGVRAWFSVDTGATVYVNSLPEVRGEVRKWLEPVVAGAPQGAHLMDLGVGGPVRLVDEHLF